MMQVPVVQVIGVAVVFDGGVAAARAVPVIVVGVFLVRLRVGLVGHRGSFQHVMGD